MGKSSADGPPRLRPTEGRQRLGKTGAEVIGIKVDVSSSKPVEDWIESTVQRFGRLDGAANLASMEGKTDLPSDLVDSTDEEWDYILSLNLTGLMYCVRAQLRVAKEGASIVNVSSLAGVVGRNGISAYSASKHGVIGLTRTVAKDVGPNGIRVNAVAPSPIRTALTERLLKEGGGTESGHPVTTSHKSMAPRHLEQLEEPINLIAFLLSDEANSITGAVYSVDGSLACKKSGAMAPFIRVGSEGESGDRQNAFSAEADRAEQGSAEVDKAANE